MPCCRSKNNIVFEEIHATVESVEYSILTTLKSLNKIDDDLLFVTIISLKFEQNDLLLATEGVSLVDTWTASSIIRFTNIPIYNLAKTSGRIRLSYLTLPPPIRQSVAGFTTGRSSKL
jgi:hypothetical protein